MEEIDFTDFKVAIRTIGERTESACYKLLADALPNHQIDIVKEQPFKKAVDTSLRMGIASRKKWLLCIDADVLINRDGLFDLMSFALKSGEDVFAIQGLIADKLLGVMRPAGNHIYRLSLATKALNLIADSLRPESDMIKGMAKNGYSWHQTGDLVGLHDYEQFYSDLFKKSFLHYIKHKKHMVDVEKFWASNASEQDYRMALWGSLAGRLSDLNQITIDSEIIAETAKANFNISWVLEKNEYKYTNKINVFIEQELSNYKSSSNHYLQNRIFPKRNWNKKYQVEQTKSIKNRVLEKLGF
ncbi:MAG: hypothetical protein RJQ09_08905 [Cyclobacteriaceae bacterium]